MPHAPVGEPDLREPAVSPELLDEPGADGLYGPTEETGGVEQVARVPQDVVAPEVRFRVAFGPFRLPARLDHGLEGVGHRVAAGRVAVPGLEREHLAHLPADKVAGKGDPLVKALLRADLNDQPGLLRPLFELRALLDRNAHRLLDQDVLAGVQGF